VPVSIRALPTGEIGFVPVGVDSLSDLIQGRVLMPDSTAAANALVIAISAKTGVKRSVRTTVSGTYLLVFPSGGGKYEIIVAVIGLAREQIQVARSDSSSIRVPDIVLQRLENSLEDVNVIATRREAPRSQRNDWDGRASDIGSEALTRFILGDGAMGRFTDAVLGAHATRDGLSVFGMAPSQTSLTLNVFRSSARRYQDP
jgi:hypothetical protein